MKKYFLVSLVLIISLFNQGSVLASGFNMKSIGGVDTSGRQISHWWYSGTVVTFSGEAGPETSVTVKINGNTSNVNADTSGEWSYSTTLEEGDHEVSFSNNGSEIKFTLTTGKENVDWEAVNSDEGTEKLPSAGVIWPGVLILLGGTGAILGSGKMIRASKK